MRGNRYRAVVFDLGGVLVEVPGAAALRELVGLQSDEEVWQRWLECAWVARFEGGECAADDFAAGFVSDWQLPLAPDEFLEAFRGWLNRPMVGASELVTDAARAGGAVALSNMNQLQWDAMAEWDLVRRFDEVFLSYRLGLAKPDPAIFEHVAKSLDAPPPELLFLDDIQVNVDAAVACGYRARRVRGVSEARTVLVEEEIVAS